MRRLNIADLVCESELTVRFLCRYLLVTPTERKKTLASCKDVAHTIPLDSLEVNILSWKRLKRESGTVSKKILYIVPAKNRPRA